MARPSPIPGVPGGLGHGPGRPGHQPPLGSSWSASLHGLGASFGGQLLVVACVVVVALVAALAVRRRAPWVFGLNPAATCLAIGSLLAVGVSTLTPRSNAWAGGTVQLIPFYTVHTYLREPVDLLIYAGGNVALFVPLGMFVYLALGRWVLASAAVCALVSVCVEALQLNIWSRSTDVDDVITNSLGGLLGALAGAAVLATLSASRRRRREREQREAFVGRAPTFLTQ